MAVGMGGGQGQADGNSKLRKLQAHAGPVLTTAAHGKELRWSEMNEGTRDKFRASAVDQWNKFVENKAVKVLTLDESKAVLQELYPCEPTHGS